MVTKSTEYAIRALVYIYLENRDHKRPGSQEIADNIEAPRAFTGKILQNLTKHNLVNSIKGRGGGFYFDDGVDFTLYDIIHVLEGDAIFTKCGFGFDKCNAARPCPIHEKYKEVRDALLNILTSESISTLSQKIIDNKAVLNRLPVIN